MGKSKNWMRQHVNDPYVKRAQTEGYRSRAAFKLIEIADKDRLALPGEVVADLGSAPGSWSQVLAQRIGPRGRVIALDVLPMDPVGGVVFIQGDFREDSVLAALQDAVSPGQLDLVVSDMSPNLTGVAVVDQARSIHLCELALDFAAKNLKRNGNMLLKVFQGTGFPEFQRAMRESFSNVVVRKPLASRDRSSELYLLGKGLKRS